MKATAEKSNSHARTNDRFFSKGDKGNFFGGNEHFFKPTTIQPKLTVGKPNDIYEKEADATADKVVQRLNAPENISTKKDSVSVANTVIQPKCTKCHDDEKVQKLDEEEGGDELVQASTDVKKPIGDDPGEEENKALPVVMKKEGDRSPQSINNLSADLSNGKANGKPLPEKTRTGMESAFGAGFNQVRIHTDEKSVQMNKALNAQAFTHGNDIYFNRGKFDTNSAPGKHLLAHELTHTIQQGKSSAVNRKRDSAISQTDSNIQAFGLLAPAFVWGGRYVLGRVVRWGIKEFVENDGELISMGSIMRREILKIPINLMGQTTFTPNAIVADHIQTFGVLAEWIKDRKTEFPLFSEQFKAELALGAEINIRFGSMGRKDKVRVRWHESTKTYEMTPYFLDFSHTAFDPEGRAILPFLGIGIDKKDSSIYGGIAALPKDLGNVKPLNRESLYALIDKKSVTHLVFGNEFGEEPFTEVGYLNEIIGGNLFLTVSGYFDTGGGQQVIGAFVLQNEVYGWSASVKLDVKGLAKSEIPIERDTKSQLTGKLPDIKLESTWNFNGLEATLNASYINNTLEIRGNATYTAKPDDPASKIQQAEFTVLVTTETKAWDEVNQQLPESADGEKDVRQDLTSLGESGDKLTVVGWGSISMILVRDENNAPKVTGNAGVVLDPDGHFTVSGAVKVEKKYELMAATGIDWQTLAYKELGPFMITLPGFPVAGVNFTGEACLLYQYILGPITLYDIEVKGIYSTNPKINKELSLSARLNLSSEFQAKAAVCGRMAARVGTSFKYLGVDVAATEVGFSGTASLKAYMDFAPTIGVKEASKEGGGKGSQYFVSGSLEIAGQLALAIAGDMKFEALYVEVADLSYHNNWPIANAGVTIDFKYNLGEKLDKESLKKMAKPKKTNFDGAKFIKGVLKNQKTDAKNQIKGGGFKDAETKKLTEAKADEIAIPDKQIAPATVIDDFNMLGQWHKLSMLVGEEGQEPDIVMATTPESLKKKIKDHGDKIKINRALITDKAQLERLDMMLADLNELRDKATRVILRAKTLGIDPGKGDKTFIPGFSQLGDALAKFGRKYNVRDIGVDAFVPPPKSDKDLPGNVGDGTYDHPIKIRWIKRGYHATIILTARKERWTRHKKTPPAGEISANFESSTPLEVPPTQARSFGKDTVSIGISKRNQIKKSRKLQRIRASKIRSMSDKFRTLLTNYNYDWIGADADHALDLGWGGTDSLDNLWPIYTEMNQRYGNGIYYQRVQYIENGELKESEPYYLIGKWFEVESIGDV